MHWPRWRAATPVSACAGCIDLPCSPHHASMLCLFCLLRHVLLLGLRPLPSARGACSFPTLPLPDPEGACPTSGCNSATLAPLPPTTLPPSGGTGLPCTGSSCGTGASGAQEQRGRLGLGCPQRSVQGPVHGLEPEGHTLPAGASPCSALHCSCGSTCARSVHLLIAHSNSLAGTACRHRHRREHLLQPRREAGIASDAWYPGPFSALPVSTAQCHSCVAPSFCPAPLLGALRI